MNTAQLHFGNNIDWLESLPSNIIDLCYIDPPFNSNVDYNIIVEGAQEKAFTDIWTWTIHDTRLLKKVVEADGPVGKWAEGMLHIVGSCGVFSYLLFMAERLVEIRRVIKETGGSIYLHCDDSMGHHLRVLMDAIFGAKNWRNSIHWKRYGTHNDSNRFGRITDTILFYGSGNFNVIKTPYSDKYVKSIFRYEDTRGKYGIGDLTGPHISEGMSGKPWRGFDPAKCGKGRCWSIPEKLCNSLGIDNSLSSQEKLDLLDKAGCVYFPKTGGIPKYKKYLNLSDGVALQDMWSDIGTLGREDVGYPTQKPLALLERIILASSNPGDLVMDCFLGSGTTAVATIKNGRNFIGCDLTHHAIRLTEQRLRELECQVDVTGSPAVKEDAVRQRLRLRIKMRNDLGKLDKLV